MLNAYQTVFEDSLFIKQTKEQTLSESNISSSLSSLLELYDYLQTIFSSHFNNLLITSSELIYQQIDLEILSLTSLKPIISESLSIPVIPTILECLSSIIITFDEIYSENSSIESHSRDLIRQTILEKQIDDICLKILIAIKRRSIVVSNNEKLYWNDVTKSCLKLIMNLSYHCSFVQVSIYFINIIFFIISIIFRMLFMKEVDYQLYYHIV